MVNLVGVEIAIPMDDQDLTELEDRIYNKVLAGFKEITDLRMTLHSDQLRDLNIKISSIEMKFNNRLNSLESQYAELRTRADQWAVIDNETISKVVDEYITDPDRNLATLSSVKNYVHDSLEDRDYVESSDISEVVDEKIEEKMDDGTLETCVEAVIDGREDVDNDRIIDIVNEIISENDDIFSESDIKDMAREIASEEWEGRIVPHQEETRIDAAMQSERIIKKIVSDENFRNHILAMLINILLHSFQYVHKLTLTDDINESLKKMDRGF